MVTENAKNINADSETPFPETHHRELGHTWANGFMYCSGRLLGIKLPPWEEHSSRKVKNINRCPVRALHRCTAEAECPMLPVLHRNTLGWAKRRQREDAVREEAAGKSSCFSLSLPYLLYTWRTP